MIFGKGDFVDKDVIATLDQLAIWHWLLGFEVDIGDRFANPFRPDKNPTSYLKDGYKWIFLSDFADRRFHMWTVLHATQHKFNLEFRAACKLLWEKFGDGNVPEVTTESLPIIEKQECIIHFVPNMLDNKPIFLQKDADYWSPLGVTSRQLREDFVYSVKAYRYNDSHGRKYQIFPTSQCYAYTGFKSGRIKIYNPFKEYGKWISNCTEYDIGFLDTIPQSGDTLFICKSYKDARIHMNLGYDCVWIQGEHFNIPDEIIIDLAARFKTVYVYFDNDRAGIEASLNLSAYCNNLIGRTSFIPMWLPESLYQENIKDNADYVLKYGVDSLDTLIASKV